MSLPKLIRFSDLKERGIVNNRVTLGQWIETQGFPPGRMLGNNTRVWDEAEITAWLESRPIEGTIKRPIPSHKRGAHAAQ